ncbi:MAG: hypothetical protein AB8E15_08105 [Bdellovibrionales bacterium]
MKWIACLIASALSVSVFAAVDRSSDRVEAVVSLDGSKAKELRFADESVKKKVDEFMVVGNYFDPKINLNRRASDVFWRKPIVVEKVEILYKGKVLEAIAIGFTDVNGDVRFGALYDAEGSTNKGSYIDRANGNQRYRNLVTVKGEMIGEFDGSAIFIFRD